MTIGSVSSAYTYQYSNQYKSTNHLNPEEFFLLLPDKTRETITQSISHLSEEERQEEIRALRNTYPFLSLVNPLKREDYNDDPIAFFLSLPREIKEATMQSISHLPLEKQHSAIVILYADMITDMENAIIRASGIDKPNNNIYEEIFSNPSKYLQKYTDPNEFKACIGRTIEAMQRASAFDPSQEQRFLPIYQDILDLLAQNDTNDYAQTKDKSASSQLAIYA
jgi:hypothetical protein